ncbi:MAG: restriction endonuclease [Eubacterium sp.]|nr:restriction endonuclease [Eubacterium sp.]
MGKAYRYRQVIVHQGLKKQKEIVARSKYELNYKIDLQMSQWNEQWARKLESEKKKLIAEQKRAEKAEIARNNEKAILYAEQLTNEANGLQNQLDSILVNDINFEKIDFDSLKSHDEFNVPYPAQPTYIMPQREPLRTDELFNPKPGLLVKLSKNKMDQFNTENDLKFKNAHDNWVQTEHNNKILNDQMNAEYNNKVAQWEKDKEEYINNQNAHNQGVDDFVKSISEGDADAVDEYIEMILDKISIPLDYDKGHTIGYNPENRNVVIDASFPTIEIMPRLKSVSYVKSKQEFKESFFTDNQITKKYDNVVYQLALIYLNRAFSVNREFDLIDAVVLNGFVDTIDKSTGNDTTACILSVRVNRDKFESLNLSAIDAKAWFRSAKGVAAANIANVTPVQPIQILNKEDVRFIEGYSVVDSINEGVNLAAIDWKDFENLISEVFGQEFSSNGGEVKITQASRDGGVDAVAFDPDPIRGGKIVIQAKRYTNVVGVSAVRDLYGTLMNEGAMKGILVTTSYFGNDAYDFANGKPIQLIDGGQLLGLLERHGHKARIDLKEAKTILNETK